MRSAWTLSSSVVVTLFLAGCPAAPVVTGDGPCNNDVDCDTGEWCSNGECAPGCNAASSCPDGTCNLATHACVACVVSSDCDAGERCTADNTCLAGCDADDRCESGHCALDTFTCVACLAHTDCPADSYCTPDRLCAPGCTETRGCTAPERCDVSIRACVTCDTNADCALGSICSERSCVPGCAADRACASGEICDVARGTCGECAVDSDCGRGKVCGPGGTCTVGCSVDDDCERPQVCDTRSNACVACTSDASCPSGRCDPTSLTCVGCLVDGDCSIGSVCGSDQRCVPGCSATRGCAAPFTCNVTSSTCVRCVEDANCGEGARCDTDSATCVECVTDRHCAAGELCGEGGRCVSGCSATQRCPGVEACDPATGQCVECVLDADCASGERCNTEQHRCVSCLSNADCAIGDVCGPAATCIAGCTATRGCPGNQVCDLDGQRCVRCLSDPDCGAGLRCDTTVSACVQCLFHSDCGGGEICVENACVAGCAPSKPCPSPDVCDVPEATCVGCLGDSDCGDSERCDVTAQRCVGCLADADCAVGNLCVAQACVPGCSATRACPGGAVCQLSTASCVACTEDTHCPAGNLCSPQNTCVSGCSATRPCTGGRVCDLPRAACVTCLSDGDCGSGLRCRTADNACVTCLVDAHCAAGSVCTASACVPGCNANQACPAGENCRNNACRAAPVVESFTPARGPVGTLVTIRGRSFGPDTVGNVVRFNGRIATEVTRWTDTELIARVPTGTTTGLVEVTNVDGSDLSPDAFVVAGVACGGTALAFPSGSSVTIGHNGSAFTFNHQLTMEARIRPVSSSTQQDIFSKDLSFQLALRNGVLQGRVYTSVGWSPWFGSFAPEAGRFSHVAFTYDGWYARTFVDGVAVSEDRWGGPINTYGSSLYVGGPTPFTGAIDELRLSRNIRYPASGFTVPAAPFGPDAHTSLLLHFDETSGAPIDASGQGLTVNASGTTRVDPGASLTCGPMLSGFSPLVGGPATRITINGVGFAPVRGTSTVTIGGKPVAQADYVSWSDGQVVVRAPADVVSGPVVGTVAGQAYASLVPFLAQPCNAASLQLPVSSAGVAGAASAVVGGTQLNVGQPQFTAELWFWSSPTTVVTPQDLVFKEFMYRLQVASGKVRAQLYNQNGWQVFTAAEELPTERWVHLAYVYDGKYLRVFADGQPVIDQRLSGDMNGYGSSLYVGGPQQAYGRIDELRLSSIARYQVPFNPPLGRFVTDSATIGLWHFDEPAGGTSFDDAGGSGYTLNGNQVNTTSDAAFACGPSISDLSPRLPPDNGGAITLVGTGFGAAGGTVTQGGTPVSVTSWSDTRVTVQVPSTGTAPLVLTTASNLRTSTGIGVTPSNCLGWSMQLPTTPTGGATGSIVVGHSAALALRNKFTLEAFVNPQRLTGADQYIFFKEFTYALAIRNGLLQARFYNDNGWTSWSGDLPVEAERWQHLAASYDGWTLRTFVDGEPGTTTTLSGLVNTYGASLFIGGGPGQLYGLVDEVRLSSVARYKERFTAPTGPFGSDASTQLLIHGTDSANTLADDSPNTLALSRSGAVTAVRDVPRVACTSLLSGVAPAFGRPGQTITLSGSGFGATRGSNTVSFGGAPVAAADYVSWSATRIQVKVPAAAATGLVRVTLGSLVLTSTHPFVVNTCGGHALQLTSTASGNSGATVVTGHSAALSTPAEVTIEGWYYPTSFGPAEQYLVHKEFTYQLAHRDGRLQFRFYTDNGWNSWVSGGDLTVETWQHIAVSYDGRFVRIFVNGAIGAEQAVSGRINTYGASLFFGGGVRQAFGLLDDVRISSIGRYKAPFTPPAGALAPDGVTVGLWRFDEGSGSGTTADSGPNTLSTSLSASSDFVPADVVRCGTQVSGVTPANVTAGGVITLSGSGFGTTAGTVTIGGTEVQVVSWSATGIVVRVPAGVGGEVAVTPAGATQATIAPQLATALRCGRWGLALPVNNSGHSGGRVVVPHAASFAGGTRHTLEGWIRPRTTVDNYHSILFKEFTHELAVRQGRLALRLYNQNGWSAWFEGGSVQLDRWTHVAATYDGWFVRLWLDGTQAAEHAFGGVVNTYGASEFVGGQSSATQFFGDIDDVRVSNVERYTRAFTPPETIVGDAESAFALAFDEGPGATTTQDLSGNTGGGSASGNVEFSAVRGGVSVCGPEVHDVQPRVGGATTVVTLRGRGFGATRGTSTVRVGDVTAVSYPTWTDRQVQFVVPAGVSTGAVTLAVGAAESRGGVDFRVAPCAGFAAQVPQSSAGGAAGAFVAGHVAALGGHGTAFTAEAWLHPIGTFTGDAIFKEFQFKLGLASDRLTASIYNSQGWVNVQSNVAVPSDWFHAAVTYDGTVRLFIDGVLVGSTNTTGGAMNTYGASLFLGGSSAAFRGEFDQVRISRTVRYTAAGFTRPTTPFVSDNSTVALFAFDEAPQSAAGGNDTGPENISLSRSGAVARWPSTAPIVCP